MKDEVKRCKRCGNVGSHRTFVRKDRNTNGTQTKCRKCESMASIARSKADPHKLTRKSWSQMKQRCNNPKHRAYQRYGGAGISYSKEWESFAQFLSDMGERPSAQHSLDRIDNTLGYMAGNCRWATFSQQNNNKTNNTKLTLCGITKNLGEWAKILGISDSVLCKRLENDWTIEEALTTPVRKSRKVSG